MTVTCVPLESNPPLLTELIHSLGTSIEHVAVYTLSLGDSDAGLLAFVSGPSLALVVVFHVTDASARRRRSVHTHIMIGPSEEWRAGEDAHDDEQTIREACALYAVLHAALRLGRACAIFARADRS